MKNRIIIFIFLFSVFFAHGQIQNNLDKIYYLLGTLDDYAGRCLCIINPNDWDKIMYLHQRDSAIIKRIEEISMLKFTKGKKRENCRNCHEFYYLLSSSAAKEINSFYVFKKQWGCEDANRNAGISYRGELKCGKILKASNEQQYSFMAGLFLTQGKKIDDVYKICLSSSPWRYKCTIKLLQALKSKILSTLITKGTVPTGFIIEFKPSEELKQILDNEIERREFFANEKL